MRISSLPKSISSLACGALLISTISLAQSSKAPDSSASTATCARACLKKFVDDYATSMLQKNTASVPVAGNVKITENTKEIKLGEGIWQTATKFYSTASSTQYVADPDTGQIARMGILNEGGKPVFFAVRLKVADNKISEIETLIGREGPAAPFQPEGYLWREAPFVREIPMKIRSSRQELLKTAGTYWTVATTTHKGSSVPYSVDCIHVENGMNTGWERPLDNIEASQPEENPQSMFDGRIWTCEREVNLTTRSFASVRNLRYIVDVERGLVMAWNIVDKTMGGGGGAGGGMGAGGPPGGPAGVARGPLEYGPPSRGPDGWPAEGPPGGMGAGGPNAPGGAPGAGGAPGGGPGGAGPGGAPQSLYHAALARIVNGKIHREQFFQVNVPKESTLPFN